MTIKFMDQYAEGNSMTSFTTVHLANCLYSRQIKYEMGRVCSTHLKKRGRTELFSRKTLKEITGSTQI
jgi:hypothetical protein